MHRFLRNISLVGLVVLPVLSACVSKKKYEQQRALAGTYQDRYNALRHDSLLMAQRIDSLEEDSTSLQKQVEELKKSKGLTASSPPVKYYRTQTISEEKEYKLKTIYLYNIANGIEWETQYKKGYFVVGVLGKSPITAVMNKEFANKKKGPQNFSVVEFTSVKDISECHVLFVSKSFYPYMSSIRTKVRDFPTLIVSEEDYAAQGAHFNLAVDGDALKMNVNRDLLKKISVTVAKSLLDNTN